MDCEAFKASMPESVYNELDVIFEEYGLTTELRLAHFLAQCAHESMEFQRVYENLNYSAARLREIFPKYFNYNQSIDYAHRPEKIANRVYANRMGNREEGSGDGFRFRGRGYFQLTGRDNYEKFNRIVDENIVREPDLVATKYPLLSAAYFWQRKELNKLADEDNIKAITKAVNGGLHGLDDRKKKFDKYMALIQA